jgi:DNA (cytosine-5)-methyltransferase 1
MKHGSLFSGIVGFDMAAGWMGWTNVFHCEINPFGRKVLNYYWPESISYEDITKTDFTIHRGQIDILTGGFPCQPFSMAGKRKGTEDDRHLWPEMLRAIREIQPRYIVGENVPGLINWDGGVVFDQVQADLENEGYEVTTFVLPACGVNAPHRRDRVWFIADTCNTGRERVQLNRTPDKGQTRKQAFRSITEFFESNNVTDTEPTGRERAIWTRKSIRFKQGTWDNWPTVEPTIRRDHDGVSAKLFGITFSKHRNESIKAYGNAIVPQVVYQIFKAIQAYENSI